MKHHHKCLFVLFVSLSFSKAFSAIDKQALAIEIKPGKNLETIFETAGFKINDARRLLRNPTVPKHLSLRPQEKVLVVNKPERSELRIYLPYNDDGLIFWRNNSETGVERGPIDFVTEKQTIKGDINGALVSSIQKLVPGDWGYLRFQDAFSFDFNLGKVLKRGDSFNFVIEKKYDHGEFVKYGEILEAELTIEGKTHRRIYRKNSEGGYFQNPDDNYQNRPFYAPMRYIHISSFYAKRRFHPVKRRYQPHLGVDFAAESGEPVLAARSGIIDDMGKHRANGYYVRIRHDNGILTWYNHLKRFDHRNFIGRQVRVGEEIGVVGCTGYCTSPHLDFRIMRGNKLYDPLNYTRPYPKTAKN